MTGEAFGLSQEWTYTPDRKTTNATLTSQQLMDRTGYSMAETIETLDAMEERGIIKRTPPRSKAMAGEAFGLSKTWTFEKDGKQMVASRSARELAEEAGIPLERAVVAIRELERQGILRARSLPEKYT